MKVQFVIIESQKYRVATVINFENQNNSIQGLFDNAEELIRNIDADLCPEIQSICHNYKWQNDLLEEYTKEIGFSPNVNVKNATEFCVLCCDANPYDYELVIDLIKKLGERKGLKFEKTIELKNEKQAIEYFWMNYAIGSIDCFY